MGVFTKKEKKPQEPQWFRSATNLRTYNYKVYYMSLPEKILYFLIAFVVGVAVGYLFYGGIGKDDLGQRTTLTWILDITIPMVVGLIAGFGFLPIRTKQILEKKQSMLRTQFRDFLEAFSTSLNAGKNVVDSFSAVQGDLKLQYDEGAFILKEIEVILSGMENNVDLEDLLADFGVRSGNDDIASFANVFKICYRKGGNIKETIRSTHEILGDKMEIMEDIETIVTSNKMEQKIMIAMPVVLIGVIKMMSPDFAEKFVTPSGLISTTIAIGLFVAAYFTSKAILNIRL